MDSSLYLFTIFLVSILLPLHESAAHSFAPPVQPKLCHSSDSSALLQFKQSLATDKLASSRPLAYPKILSWTPQTDCCSWDGVDCDDEAHVIGLNLTSSLLFGSINSSSTLFRLNHLQWLSLADNHFNFSPIPPELCLFSTSLTHLNLSMSKFSGQIPSEISILSKLTVLDLTSDEDSSSRSLLQLKGLAFETLVQNLTNLEQLWLTSVDISSRVPNSLANLSSLTDLSLSNCNLQGEFPFTIFLLPNIQFLSIQDNQQLTGSLPQFSNHSVSALKFLLLRNTSFSGELPDSIQNLGSLTVLDMRNSKFSGPIPPSCGNLTKLTSLYLSDNNFTIGGLSWLAQLTKLQGLGLNGANISSEVPSSLANLTELKALYLRSCQLTGAIPLWFQNLNQLTKLDLALNFLQGPISKPVFSKLVNMEWLVLDSNNFSGSLEVGIFGDMRNLTALDLGNNQISVLDDGTQLPSLYLLDLTSCNLKKFPDFIKHQQELSFLSLERNNIHGQMPSWFCYTSRETLVILDLSNNFLTGFYQCSGVLPWVNLEFLDLSHNSLRGSLPIPAPSTNYYNVRNNTLTGEIPSLFCNLKALYVLELSLNNLGGKLPECLGGMSDLSVLSLNSNNFSGTVPQMCTARNSRLEIIDLSENQIQGEMPRSLANCTMLRSLDVRENQINDTFPFCMGKLDGLQLLVLRSNRFHGVIETFADNSEFSNLRIIDLSHNGFSGYLPSTFFHNWKGMEKTNPIHLMYMESNKTFSIPYVQLRTFEVESMVLANKGIEMEYGKIPYELAAIDFSSNNFSGEITESIGNLNGLYVLNLSNNNFRGHIPSSLGNLTVLESLDLSHNKLSGEIPRELTELNFLAFLDVSQNNLTGQVPRGKQLDTFQDNSFDGNSALCGELLMTMRCRGSAPPSPAMPICSENHKEGESFPGKSDWIAIMLGCAGGLVIGFIIGNTLVERKPEWFGKVFGTNMKRKHRRHRN